MTDPLGPRDPRFPALHRVHPHGWLNDPNGILRTADGRWHVFFQYNPSSARHENIRWGHMSSSDLVGWREEPMGPAPRPGEADRGGCWSGVGLLDRSADPAGVPTLVYSGVDGVEDQFSRVIVSRLDASGTGLVEPGTVVADVPAIEGLLGVRDPFVFTHGGRRWAIQGAGVRESGGYVPTLPLYSCDDLEQWELVGSLLHGDDPIAAEHAPADLWECPQLVELDGHWVLLLSLWRRPETHDPSTIQVNYLVGDMESDGDGVPRFVPTGGGRVDLGPDFYAPQAVVDADADADADADGDPDRVLLWGWSWEGEGRTQALTDAQGWAGTLTFPRELRLVDGELRSLVPRELTALRAEQLVIDRAGSTATLEVDAPARLEVRLRGDLRVEVLGGDGGAATEALTAEAGPAVLFLDGSLLELLPEAAAPHTRRFEAGAGARVRLSGDLEAAWRLERPGAAV
ncbi:glycoside hydrolase family 32 protein [Brachybacterium sp. AOP43-C2-M15]|uniref:glycoside hydrolase family 32 protein n=1 Tax=Brachybacterium sp. AOP43-C2-M15 TaxID=3457661 RepID=UPI0040335404